MKTNIAFILLAVLVLLIVGVFSSNETILPEIKEKAANEAANPVINPVFLDEPDMLQEPKTETETMAPGLTVSGRVINAKTKQPLEKYELTVYDSEDSLIVEDEIENPDGVFSVPIKSFGKYAFLISSEGYHTRETACFISSEDELNNIEIEILPAYSLSGRVVDDITELPIEGAIMGYVEPRSEYMDDGTPLELNGQNKTDKNGRFFLYGLGNRDYIVFALHRDYVQGFVKTKPVSEIVEVRLNKSGFRVYGTVLDDSGNPLNGIDISLVSKGCPEERHAITDEAGRYKSPLMPAGTTGLFVPSNENFIKEVKWVEIIDSDLKVNFGHSDEYATWRGRFQWYDGTPIDSGKVSLGFSAHFSGFATRKYNYSAVSDAGGYFEIKKIHLGEYNANIRYPDGPAHYRFNTVNFTEPGIYTQDITIPNTMISGYVIDGAVNKPLENEFPEVSAIQCYAEKLINFTTIADKIGFYIFTGLPPGTYLLDANILYDDRQYLAWSLPIVKIEEGVPVKKDIAVPAAGDMKYSILGLDNLEGNEYEVRMYYESDIHSCCGIGVYKFPEKRYSKEVSGVLCVAEGLWTVKIITENGIVSQESVTVERGKTSPIKIIVK
ncbi:MAG: carboxypeptidase-like regulatory domain-containing protein [Planctomycetes bacterium]|nr:carboxypeptidase-like regulatory domain-containing protein [Planctomycetota bacterium]